MKSIKTLGAVGMLVGLCFSSQAVILLPGQSGLDPVQAPGPAPLANVEGEFSNFGSLNGTVNSWVVKDPANPLGGLSFYYQINNTGPETVTQLSVADFGLVPFGQPPGTVVEVSTITAPFSTSVPGGVAPSTATRSAGFGSDVGFMFSSIAAGQNSVILVVNTAFQAFGLGSQTVFGNNNDSGDAVLLAPALTSQTSSLAQTPEPATVIAASVLLLPFGLTLLRNLRKRQTVS